MSEANIPSPLFNGSIFEDDSDSTKSIPHPIFENFLNRIDTTPNLALNQLLNSEEDYEIYNLLNKNETPSINPTTPQIEIHIPKILFNVRQQITTKPTFGRKRLRPLNDFPKIHSKFDQDNMGRKIQVNYMDFLFNFVNFCIKHPIFGINENLQFKKVGYDFKKNVNRKSLKANTEKTIGQILAEPEISKKYKKFEEIDNFFDHNKKIFEKLITKSEKMKKLLSGNYLSLFNNYYKSDRKINLSQFGIDEEICLSKNIKLFDDLLNKGKNKEVRYQKEFVKFVEKKYNEYLHSK